MERRFLEIGVRGATRTGPIRSDTGALNIIFSGLPKEDLVKRGVVEVDGGKYPFYLPKAKSYTTKNDKPSDSGFESAGTQITVDQNGDGKFAEVASSSLIAPR